MNQKTRRILTCIVLVVLAMAMLFSMVASAASGAITEAAYIKQLYSVDTQYKNYLDSSMVFQLPSTINKDDVISIIVMLDDPALLETYNKGGDMTLAEYVYSDAGDKLRSEIEYEKKQLTARLDDLGINYTLGAEYTTVLSGYEILVKAKYYDEVANIIGSKAQAIIGEVYNVADSQVVENNVKYYEKTGIFDSSDFEFDGSGMVVAVLDTGLDYTHDAFSLEKFTSNVLGLTKEDVELVLQETNAAQMSGGLFAGDVYVSDKVPFAFDYADVDPDVYSIHNNHGTHVSGVIAGNSDVITGVAPNAQIVSMKIFSDTYDSARASWILSALEDCVTLGVDVINMSLGTACGFSRESDEEALSGVYDRIREQGISLVVAASNSFNSAYGSEKNGNLGLTSNPDIGTVGSPSTYDGAMSIASVSGTKTPYILFGDRVIYFVEASNSANKEKYFFDDLLGEREEASYEYVVIPGAGKPADYTDLDVKGKIVLVRRGATTFEEKANAAQKAGAAGIIVYNNTSGEIKMNVGITSIAVCSISQDDGEVLAAAKTGTIKIARKQAAGPFMSDFSSWGPTPDLHIKPEITAHGGNILSAVTGNEYDRLSGTSMACPNMAGVIALLRQYVIKYYPKNEITYANGEFNYPAVNAVVNRLLMSTADILNNKNALPYAVRKQGAGLANLTDAAATSAYIVTYKNGQISSDASNWMDTSKLELGDDPTKSGVYTLTFSVYNFGTTALTYNISTIVMTEGVSETPTYAGETVVSEEGYLLGASTSVQSLGGGTLNGTEITVAAGSLAHLQVTITLSDADKAYLDKSFENGMYVEGFVKLDAVSGTDVDLSCPYLAFYGDWTKAPLFDLDYYDTNADELDDSIATLDKTLPDAYASRPIGGIEQDYINYMGGYYFVQNPADKIIAASRDYIAISNTEGTVHSLRFCWMGMLRNAEKIVVTIVDDATGEGVFTTTEYNVRKSYGDGGSYIYPANVEIEFDAFEHNLKNNTTYSVKLQGYLDYGDGGLTTNENSTFEFPLTTDFEAPALTGIEYYTEYDRNAKKTRLFAKMAIYDNHYAMSMQVGYIANAPEDSEYETIFNNFSKYMTPIYSEKNSTTYVTYELTDYIYAIKDNGYNKNTFAISVYDYALNIAVYEVPLPDDYIDATIEESEITLNPNEVYTVNPLVYPSTEWAELLTITSNKESVVRVVNNKLVATGSGKAIVTILDETTGVSTRLFVTVRSPGDAGYRVMTKPVADEFSIDSFTTLKAYYQLDNTEADLGETDDIIMFDNLSLSMFPSESVQLNLRLKAYFPEDVEVVYTSGNSNIVTVSETGVVTAQEYGTAAITVRLRQDGKNTSYSKTIMVNVKEPFVRTGPQLTHYFGLGGVVTIPGNLLITEIGQYAFSNYNYIPKDLTAGDVIDKDNPDATKIAFIGDNTITKVIIPEGVEKIGPYAFANLTALTEVVLPSTLKYIEYGAFYGCNKLTTVKGLENVVTINSSAFEGCNLQGTISLDSAHAINDYAFAGNRNLEKVVISETLRSIGKYAFAGCAKLSSVTINAEKVKLGEYVFTGCSSLKEITINTGVIPKGAFMNCSSLENVTFGKDVSAVGAYAFMGTKLSGFTIVESNATYGQVDNAPYLLSKDGKTLLLVAPATSGTFTLEGVTAVADGAFSGNTRITSVNMPDVTSVGAYAFADCSRLSSITLGKLNTIGEYAFAGTAISTLPDIENVANIGRYAFMYTNITEVIIGDYVVVGEGAFCECEKLTSVTVGDNAKLGFGAFMLSRTQSTYKQAVKVENGITIFYFEYLSPIKSITIGKNVEIGDAAFLGAAKVTEITIGEGSTIGASAFYNCSSLTTVHGIEGVTAIGELAFSGDVNYVYKDNNYQVYLVVDNSYVYEYHAAPLTSLNLASVETLGEQAFLYCLKLETVVLGDNITEVPASCFRECLSLKNVTLGGTTVIGEQAFAYAPIESIDLSNVTSIGNYAFIYCTELGKGTVTLNPLGCEIGEGAFGYTESLKSIANIDAVTSFGPYSFAYSAIVNLDLSGAVKIGDHAFMKEELTPVTLTLSENLVEIGDNPFAYCSLTPFSTVVEVGKLGDNVYTDITYTFDLSDTVKIIDGSIYAKVPYGLELITYIPNNNRVFTVDEDTVRISSYAFAASDVVMVTLPHKLNAIGHKAFFDCMSLNTVVFKSYEAPVLEEEFDMEYYQSYENLPANGDYQFTDYDGNVIVMNGLAIVPFDMIEPYAYYSNTYYGANFVGHIGHYNPSLTMIAPSNGKYYDTFIMSKYFAIDIDGAVAADDTTLAAIEAILAMPTPVQLSDEALVIAARQAYNRIVSNEQRALVDEYYGLLQSAEMRIEMFKNAGSTTPDDTPDVDDTPASVDAGFIVLLVFVILESVIILGAVAFIVVYFIVIKKNLSLLGFNLSFEPKAKDESAECECECGTECKCGDNACECGTECKCGDNACECGTECECGTAEAEVEEIKTEDGEAND